jgi:hypothetical protein
MTRPRVVRWSWAVLLFGALLALEALLGFGTEVRAALIAALALSLQRMGGNSRQFDRSDEEAIGPKDVKDGPIVDP